MLYFIKLSAGKGFFHLKRAQAFRAVTKALIVCGGCIFICSRSARRISFENNCNDN